MMTRLASIPRIPAPVRRGGRRYASPSRPSSSRTPSAASGADPYELDRVQFQRAVQKAALPAEPNLERVARQYVMSQGLEPNDRPLDYVRVDEPSARRVAAQYESAAHSPHHPATRDSYEALKRETVAQFRHLQQKGYKLEPWPGAGQPYQNSEEMTRDVHNNRHLFFFTGGDIPSDHPLASQSGLSVGGVGLTHNDAFRAVHDVFGHAHHGNQFGPRGEEHAWRAHSRMFSPAARPAMTSETKGQNSWVNFGPHSHRPVTDRPFAPQKATILKMARARPPAHIIDALAPPPPPPPPVPEERYRVPKHGGETPFPPRPSKTPPPITSRRAPELSASLEELRARFTKYPDAPLPVSSVSLKVGQASQGLFGPVPPKAAKDKHVARVAGDIIKALRGGEPSLERYLHSNKIPPKDADGLRVAAFILAGADEATHHLKTADDAGADWYKSQVGQYVDGIRHLAQSRWGYGPEVFGHPGDPKMSPQMRLYMAMTAGLSNGKNPTDNAVTAYRIFDLAVKKNPENPWQALPLKNPNTASGAWSVRHQDAEKTLSYLHNLTAPRGGEQPESAHQRAADFLTDSHSPEYVRKVKDFLHGRPVSTDLPFGDKNSYPGSYIFGPKLGAFYQNLTGDDRHLTADVWWARTWGRVVGGLFDHRGKLTGGPKGAQQRVLMDRAARGAAKHLGMSVADFQAVMWYYEKELYEAMGQKKSTTSYVEGIHAVLQEADPTGRLRSSLRESTAARQRAKDAVARKNRQGTPGGRGAVALKTAADSIPHGAKITMPLTDPNNERQSRHRPRDMSMTEKINREELERFRKAQAAKPSERKLPDEEPFDLPAKKAAKPIGGGPSLVEATHSRGFHPPRTMTIGSMAARTGLGRQGLESHFKGGGEMVHGDYSYKSVVKKEADEAELWEIPERGLGSVSGGGRDYSKPIHQAGKGPKGSKAAPLGGSGNQDGKEVSIVSELDDEAKPIKKSRRAAQAAELARRASRLLGFRASP